MFVLNEYKSATDIRRHRKMWCECQWDNFPPKGFIFEDNENLQQLAGDFLCIYSLPLTMKIMLLMLSNIFFYNFSLNSNIEPTASSRLDIEHRISNNEPAANFTYIFQPYAPIQIKIENGNGECAKETTTRP